ncbi:SRPBCC family protein [Bacillus oleivorans]|uniref:SRPBCC family protein n=1 Tax=Bacillus oleivorans TaxID=1448271 RepID=UPI001FE32392|nr:SRPBCC domain-containing protein [Bacillus oleivorans]
MTYTRAEHTDLIVERIFDAPKSLVFEAFSKAEHLERWFGVEGWTLPVCNIDFRPGGVWHYCMQSPDGKIKSWGKAVYQEIVEPEQIVYVDYFSDEEGNIAEEMPAAQITMTFEEQEGKTLLLSRTRYDSPENLKKVIDMGVIAGITQTWNRLAQFLGELK